MNGQVEHILVVALLAVMSNMAAVARSARAAEQHAVRFLVMLHDRGRDYVGYGRN